jgi:drug/metabolite transporter, DME family
MSRLTKGTLIAVISVVFWSSSAVFISHLTSTYKLQPLLLAFWRDLFTCLSVLALLIVKNRALPRVTRGQLKFFVLYGVVLTLFNSVWTLSVPENGAAAATVLAYGSVGFTVPLAGWIFKEKVTAAKILGVFLSIGGCVLVANAYNAAAWNTRPLGIIVGLLSGLMFAIYSLVGKEAAHRGIDSWLAMFYTFGFASAFLLLINLFPTLPGVAGSAARLMPQLPPFGWLLLVTLALVPTLLGYGLYNLSLNYLPASIANLIATLEPAFTAAQAYVLLGESMAIIQVGGSLLIIAAVVIVRISEGMGREPEPVPAVE